MAGWSNYLTCPCLVYIPGGSPGSCYVDERGPKDSDRYTVLSPAGLAWLINIRAGYLVFRSRDCCITEPYLPCRFARQFGYDQFLVGNPHQSLWFIGSLSQASRCWFFSIAGCTHARFMLPREAHSLRQSFGFCRWYSRVNQFP